MINLASCEYNTGLNFWLNVRLIELGSWIDAMSKAGKVK